jgi:tripartite ATP-independent transporter DctM subunit
MIFLFCALGLLALMGMPIFAVILAAAILGFYSLGIDLSVIAIELSRISETPYLMALPLFTLAGYVMSESGTPQRIVRLTQAMVGWMPGSLAIVSLTACAVLTAFTGASGVTIVALGALLYPALTQSQYGEKFSLGLITASGSLGLLFPPSVPIILYGIIVQQMGTTVNVEISDLFLAGLFPGLMMLIFLSLWSLWTIRHKNIPKIPFSAKKLWMALRNTGWEFPLPLFVLGGVYSGYLAISEAASVSVIYVIVIEVFVYKEITFSQLPAIFRNALVMSGGVLIIIGVSMASTNFLIDAEVPTRAFNLIKAHISNKLVFLVLLNLLLLGLGAILDIFSAIVIMVPLILPVAIGYGIDPVHLGIIFLANMQIGYSTPPVGMNLFIASYRFKKSVIELYYAAIPFMLVLIVALAIITYWPPLSLFLLKR